MQDGNTGARAEGRVGGARRGGRRSNTMLTFSMFCIDQGGNLAVRRHPFWLFGEVENTQRKPLVYEWPTA